MTQPLKPDPALLTIWSGELWKAAEDAVRNVKCLDKGEGRYLIALAVQVRNCCKPEPKTQEK